MKTTKRTTRTETTRTETTTTVVVEKWRGKARHAEAQTGREPWRELPHRRPVEPVVTQWHHLQTFFIEYPPRAGGKNKMDAVPQVKIFANGRQQVPIRVVLSPRDASGVYVSVPEEELKAMVNLIDYNTGELLPVGWTAHWDENEYSHADWAIPNAPGKSSSDYVPRDHRPQGNDGLAADQVAVTYYVTSDRVGSLMIAASVKPPQASQPIDTRPGASGNQFDSAVNIDVMAALNLPPSSFNHRWADHSDNAYFTIHNCFITLFHDGRQIKLLHVADESDRINGYVNIHADDGDFRPGATANSGGADTRSWEGVFSALVYNEASRYKVAYGDVPDYLNSLYVYNHVGKAENPEAGAICYMQHLFGENLHFYWGGTENATEVNQRRVQFIDEFGNSHRVVVGNGSSSIGGDFSVVANW